MDGRAVLPTRPAASPALVVVEVGRLAVGPVVAVRPRRERIRVGRAARIGAEVAVGAAGLGEARVLQLRAQREVALAAASAASSAAPAARLGRGRRARRSRRAPGSWRRCCCSSTSWLSLPWGRCDERRPTRSRVTGFGAPIRELAHVSGYMRLASAASSAVFSISSPTSSTEAPASIRLRMSCRRVSCWTICGTWSRFSMKRQT